MQRMHISNTLVYSLPWLLGEIDELKKVFGNDWWPYGIEANRHVLESLIRYMGEQGLLKTAIRVEDLFVPNLGDEFKK